MFRQSWWHMFWHSSLHSIWPIFCQFWCVLRANLVHVPTFFWCFTMFYYIAVSPGIFLRKPSGAILIFSLWDPPAWSTSPVGNSMALKPAPPTCTSSVGLGEFLISFMQLLKKTSTFSFSTPEKHVKTMWVLWSYHCLDLPGMIFLGFLAIFCLFGSPKSQNVDQEVCGTLFHHLHWHLAFALG